MAAHFSAPAANGRFAGHAQPTHLTRAGSQTIQLAIKVNNIDFDPSENAYRHADIDAAFFNALKTKIRRDASFSAYLPQLDNVINAIKDGDYDGTDIEVLATSLTATVRKAFSDRHMVIAERTALADKLKAHILSALVDNLTPYWAMEMNREEAAAFDLMKAAAATMSRKKEEPSEIQYARLPGTVKPGVDAVVAELRIMIAKWTAALFTFAHNDQVCPNDPNLKYLIPGEIIKAAVADLDHYQGNHTNLAKWLPDVPMPANRIKQVYTQMASTASLALWARLDSKDPIRKLALRGDGLQHNNAHKTALRTAVRAANFTTAEVKNSVWAELGQGVSAYIEFNLPGDISRLVYDPGRNKIYLSAHYHWRDGYNPWFYVSGIQV